MYDFMYLFLMFLFYSILGYIIEIVFCAIVTKKFTASRGYLFGPYIPVFGFGTIIMVNLLDKYKDDIFILFIMSMVICSVVEYFTSLLLEKIFNLRWWDYSHESFNINGRICLKVGVLLGLGGVIITKYFNPLLTKFLSTYNENIIIIVGSIFFVIVILDALISTFLISKLKIDSKKYLNQDATDVVKKQVLVSLRKYNVFYKRMLRAFPHINLNANIIKLKEFMEEQMDKTLRLVKIKDDRK